MAEPVTPPSITSVAFDKPSGYSPGDLITATVTYTAGSSQTPVTQTLTGTATDSVTGQSGQLTQTFTVAGAPVSDDTSVEVSDTGSRTWTLVADTGTVATFTATA